MTGDSMGEQLGRRSRSWRKRTSWAVIGCGAAVTLAAGAYMAASALSNGPTSVPSCSWPLRVRGPANTEQAGLVRCYLRALARRDTSGMLAVADTDVPVRITRADFTHADDARSGIATAIFRRDAIDGAYVDVILVFADGAHASVPMDLANPASWHSWRMLVGS